MIRQYEEAQDASITTYWLEGMLIIIIIIILKMPVSLLTGCTLPAHVVLLLFDVTDQVSHTLLKR